MEWPVPCLQSSPRFALRPGQHLPLSQGFLQALKPQVAGWFQPSEEEKEEVGSELAGAHAPKCLSVGRCRGGWRLLMGEFSSASSPLSVFLLALISQTLHSTLGDTKGPAWIYSAGGRVFIWVHFSGAELCQAVCDSSDLPMIALKEMRHTK